MKILVALSNTTLTPTNKNVFTDIMEAVEFSDGSPAENARALGKLLGTRVERGTRAEIVSYDDEWAFLLVQTPTTDFMFAQDFNTPPVLRVPGQKFTCLERPRKPGLFRHGQPASSLRRNDFLVHEQLKSDKAVIAKLKSVLRPAT